GHLHPASTAWHELPADRRVQRFEPERRREIHRTGGRRADRGVPGAMTVRCTREQAREAAVWMTLLNGPDRTAKVDRGLRRWLAAHPGNARAFEAASRGWEAAGQMPRAPFPHHLAAVAPGRPVWRRFAPAAAVLVLAVTTWF